MSDDIRSHPILRGLHCDPARAASDLAMKLEAILPASELGANVTLRISYDGHPDLVLGWVQPRDDEDEVAEMVTP